MDNEVLTATLNDGELKSIFDDKFIQKIADRYDLLATRTRSSALFQWTIMLLLGMTLLSVRPSLSLFGMTIPDTNAFREVLLVALATTQMAGILPTHEQMRLREILTAYVNERSRGNAAVAELLRIQFGIGSVIAFKEWKEWAPSRSEVVTLLLALVGGVGWLILVLSTFVLIEVVAVIDVVRNPAISATVGVFVALYVIFANAAVLGVWFLSGANRRFLSR